MQRPGLSLQKQMVPTTELGMTTVDASTMREVIGTIIDIGIEILSVMEIDGLVIGGNMMMVIDVGSMMIVIVAVLNEGGIDRCYKKKRAMV